MYLKKIAVGFFFDFVVLKLGKTNFFKFWILPEMLVVSLLKMFFLFCFLTKSSDSPLLQKKFLRPRVSSDAFISALKSGF